MYRSILNVILIVVVAFSCKKENTTHPDDELQYPIVDTIHVISYNVAGLPEGISSSQPASNTSEIGRRLNTYDIVSVQEDFNYNHFLYGTSNHPYKTKWSGPVPFGDGLNVMSRYKLTDLDRQKWKDCYGTDCLTPKGFSYNRIEIQGGASIDFYNIHANAGKSKEDQQTRRSNLLQMYDYIEKHSEGRAVIIAGDFNSRYALTVDTLEVYRYLGFLDTWIEYSRKGVYPDKGVTRLDACDNLSSGDCETVDKILFRSNEQVKFKLLDYQKQQQEFVRDGEDLSDHWPITSLFEITIMY